MANETPDLESMYRLLRKVEAENENCARDIADMRLELEQIKVQKTLLSGSLQEAEQRLAEARALLERWKATVEDEMILTADEVSVRHDTTYFLAKR